MPKAADKAAHAATSSTGPVNIFTAETTTRIAAPATKRGFTIVFTHPLFIAVYGKIQHFLLWS